MNSYHIKVDEDISEDIIDNGDQNVGSFDLECMSEPNGCCTKGNASSTYFLQLNTQKACAEEMNTLDV